MSDLEQAIQAGPGTGGDRTIIKHQNTVVKRERVNASPFCIYQFASLMESDGD